MSTESIAIATLPHTTRLFRDYLAMSDSDARSSLRQWYGAEPLGSGWMKPPAVSLHAAALADALEAQSLAFGADRFANGVAELTGCFTRAVAGRAGGFALDFAAGARKLAGFSRLFSCLVPCLPGDFTGMLASLAGNFAGFGAIPPVAILIHVREGAARRKHRNQQHATYLSRHTASFFKVQTNRYSFCSENFR